MMTVEVFQLMLDRVAEDDPKVLGLYRQIIGFGDTAVGVRAILEDAESWKEQGLHYRKVADVDGDDKDVAYCLTNHIDESWTNNKGVTVAPGVDRVRSTSVGDLMVVDGKFHVVCGHGFSEISDSQVDIDRPRTF